MVKREKGFNPDCGDWEFIVFDGTGPAARLNRSLAEQLTSLSTPLPAPRP